MKQWRQMMLSGVLCGLMVGWTSAANAPTNEPSSTALPELPWVVRIDTVGGASPVQDDESEHGRRASFKPADGPTTGVVWSADGWIVTSSFNFAREPLVILVTLNNGRQMVAKLIARDLVTQLALLRVEGQDLPTPRPLTRDAVPLGASVYAVGFGYASRGPALNHGVISALYRIDGLALQTDANTSPANYGGPLVDDAGRLLGVIVPLATRTSTLESEESFKGVDFYDSGIGFAIPVDLVAERVALMAEGQDLEPGRIGLGLDSRTSVVGNPETAYVSPPVAGGVLVGGASASPANEHDICPGDIIVAVNDIRVGTIREMRRMLAPRIAGETLKLTLLRDNEPRDVMLTLASTADPEDDPNAVSTDDTIENRLKRMRDLPLPGNKPNPQSDPTPKPQPE